MHRYQKANMREGKLKRRNHKGKKMSRTAEKLKKKHYFLIQFEKGKVAIYRMCHVQITLAGTSPKAVNNHIKYEAIIIHRRECEAGLNTLPMAHYLAKLLQNNLGQVFLPDRDIPPDACTLSATQEAIDQSKVVFFLMCEAFLKDPFYRYYLDYAFFKPRVWLVFGVTRNQLKQWCRGIPDSHVDAFVFVNEPFKKNVNGWERDLTDAITHVKQSDHCTRKSTLPWSGRPDAIIKSSRTWKKAFRDYQHSLKKGRRGSQQDRTTADEYNQASTGQEGQQETGQQEPGKGDQNLILYDHGYDQGEQREPVAGAQAKQDMEKEDQTAEVSQVNIPTPSIDHKHDKGATQKVRPSSFPRITIQQESIPDKPLEESYESEIAPSLREDVGNIIEDSLPRLHVHTDLTATARRPVDAAEDLLVKAAKVEQDRQTNRRDREAIEQREKELDEEKRLLEKDKEQFATMRKCLQNQIYQQIIHERLNQPTEEATESQLINVQALEDLTQVNNEENKPTKEEEDARRINNKEDVDLETFKEYIRNFFHPLIYHKRPQLNELCDTRTTEDQTANITQGDKKKKDSSGVIAETKIFPLRDMLSLTPKGCSVGTQTEFLSEYYPPAETTTTVEPVVEREEEPEALKQTFIEGGETTRDPDEENMPNQESSSLERSSPKDFACCSGSAEDLPDMGQIVVPQEALQDGSPQQAVEQGPQKFDKNIKDKKTSDGESVHFKKEDSADDENLPPSTSENDTSSAPETDKPFEESEDVEVETLGSKQPVESVGTGHPDESSVDPIKSPGMDLGGGLLKDPCDGSEELGTRITSYDIPTAKPQIEPVEFCRPKAM